MNSTHTLAQLFAYLHSQLMAMQLDVESNPERWHTSIQKAVQEGAFYRLEFGYGLSGVLVCQLVLMSPSGHETLPVSPMGRTDHV